jgi:hypothetical protein
LARRPGRGSRAGTGFTIVWMTLWTSAILVALWALGGAAWRGELPAILFLAVWVAGAGYALGQVARQLRARLQGEEPPRRPHRDHRWEDGIEPPPPPPAG